MNRTPFRAANFGQRIADLKTTELETLDTVSFAAGLRSAAPNVTRATVSLLALGLVTVSTVTARADDTSATNVRATPAKAPKKTKAALLPAIKTDLPRFTLTAKRQDPPTPVPPTVPTTPDATKPATPPTTAQTPAAATTPAPPAPGSVAYSGLIDIYYGVNTRAPRAANNGPFATTITPDGTHLSADNQGRSFDVNDRDPTLSLAELNIVRTHNKSVPVDITATLTLGETSRFVHATEPGGTGAWSFLQQLYLTYTPHVLGRDIAIDFGKFVTPFGVEVIESVNNDNYSRSFDFQYGIPFYHAGLRATLPIDTKGLFTFTGEIVNGWNNVADDNNGKSIIGQVTWKPTAKLTGIFGVMGGPEGTGAYGSGILKGDGNINTNIYDAQAIYQMDAKTKFTGWVTYGAGSGDATGFHYSDNWLGITGYARRQFTPVIAGAIRVEQFEDNNGLRTGTLGYTKLNEVTLTGEYATLRGHLIARLEYRHDHANQSTFFGAGVGGTTPDQDTITLSGVYKF